MLIDAINHFIAYPYISITIIFSFESIHSSYSYLQLEAKIAAMCQSHGQEVSALKEELERCRQKLAAANR